MNRIGFSLTILGAALAPLIGLTPAAAQATRTWVSGVGNDIDPCSRTAPCKTFAGAISKTADNGEINCLDPGGFGAVTITKNMTIDCSGTIGSIVTAGGNGIIVNNATSSAVLHVILRNLSIQGGSGCVQPPTPGCLPATPSLNAVRFLVSGSLHLDHVVIQNFTATGNGIGVDFRPNNNSKLMITDSFFVNVGSATSGAGVQIRPSAGSTTAILKRVAIERGLNHGVLADSTAGTTGINLTVQDSTIHGNAQDGIQAKSSGVAIGVMVERSAITANTNGLHADGNAAAVIRVGASTLTGNGTATSATAGGQVLSYLNNAINGNGVDTTPPTVPGGLH